MGDWTSCDGVTATPRSAPVSTGLKMFMMADLEAVRSLPEFAGQKGSASKLPTERGGWRSTTSRPTASSP